MAGQTKKGLRQSLAQQVAALEEDYLARSDADIHRHVAELAELEEARTVFCYISVTREPDTRRLIETLLGMGKRVCVPRCVCRGVMEARQITGFEQLHPAGYGLLEPDETAPLVPPEAIDLVVAPCVAVTRQGVRLGHGGGFYDRFLEAVKAPVVCLSREALIQEALPQEAFDKPVDMVVTEAGVHRCKSKGV